MPMNVLTAEQRRACPEAQHWIDTFDLENRTYEWAVAARATEAAQYLSFYNPHVAPFVAAQDNVSDAVKQTFNILAAAHKVQDAIAAQDSIAYIEAYYDLLKMMEPPAVDASQATTANAVMLECLAQDLVDRTSEAARFRAKEDLGDRLVACINKADPMYETYIQLKSQAAFGYYVEVEKHYRADDDIERADRNLRKAFDLVSVRKVVVDDAFRAHVRKHLGNNFTAG